MRIVRPVIVLLVALLLAAAALIYMDRQARQEWIYVQSHRPSSPDHDSNYHSTYYTLPSDSSARPSGER
jgi:cell division protein FtsL